MTRSVNAKNVFTKEIRDTNDHYLPNQADHSAVLYDVRGQDVYAAKVVNGMDQDAVVDLEATTNDDPTFAEGDTIVAAVTVAKLTGGKPGTEILSSDKPLSYLRVHAKCSIAPTAGNLKVVFESKKRGR